MILSLHPLSIIMMFRKILFFICFITLLSSCSKYQKVLKSEDLNLKYDHALLYFNKKDYNRALPLLEELSTAFRGSAKAETVSYYYANCHYELKDYLMASYLYDSYCKTFPQGKYSEECQFKVAFCYYLESPSYQLDNRNIYKAIDHLQLFVNLYPKSEKVANCNQLIDELRNRLATKAFFNAKQYHKTEFYNSAIIALKNVIIDFPGNNYEEDIYFLILDSSFLLAKNSISKKQAQRLQDTIDAYQEFLMRFPNTKYKNNADDIHQKTTKLIEINNQS